MISKSNYIKIAALILIAIFLLSSCTNQSYSKRTVYKGYKSLETTFSKSIPDNLYENSTFSTRIIIVNEGTYTINQSNPAVASITTDEFYMQYNQDQWQGNKTFTLEGKSTMFPNGEFIIFDLPEFSMQLLPGAIQKPETELQFNLCYPYETTFSENICIDVDPYEQDRRPAICRSEELTLSGGQGSPIAVTKITPVMTSTTGNIKPKFIIEIKNYGKGIPLYDEEEDKLCGNLILDTNNLNKVKISGIVSNLNLTCNPEIIKLIDDEGETRCTVDSHFGSATNFIAPLNLKIEFNYFQSITKEFDIIRTQEYDPLSFATSKSCEGLNEGSYCSNDHTMVCDAEKQCITRCSYCAKNPGELPELCNGIGVDYTCGCSLDDRYFMPPNKYIIEACDFGLCCDQGERGIGIYYSSKSHIYGDEGSYSEYKKLGENKKATLTPLTDYKFKPFYSNSNAYCSFRMLKQYNGGQGSELLFTTDRNLCSNPSNVLNYLFNETEVGQIYELQVAAYETETSETPIKSSSHELTIGDMENCQYNGQILSNNMVCSLEFDHFYTRNKCIFCNMDWNEDIDFCKQANSGFRRGMSCMCDENFLSFMDSDDYVSSDQNFCEGSSNDYCCLHPESLHNYLEIYMNCSTISSCGSYTSSFEDVTAAQVCLADPCNMWFSDQEIDDFCYWDYQTNVCQPFNCEGRTSCFDYSLLTMSGVVNASAMCDPEMNPIPQTDDFCGFEENCYWSETECVAESNMQGVYCSDSDGCLAYGSNQNWCLEDTCNFARYDNTEFCYWNEDDNQCDSMLTTDLENLNCEEVNLCTDYTFEYQTTNNIFSAEELCLTDLCSIWLENSGLNPCYWDEDENHCKEFECNEQTSCFDYNQLILSRVANVSAMCDPPQDPIPAPTTPDYCNFGDCYWSETECVIQSPLQGVDCSNPDGCLAYGANQNWCESDTCNFARYDDTEECYWDGNSCVAMMATDLSDLNCDNIYSCNDYTFVYQGYTAHEICLEDPCDFTNKPIDVTNIDTAGVCYWNDQENHCRIFDCDLEESCETYNYLNHLEGTLPEAICGLETTCDYRISENFVCSWDEDYCYDVPLSCENGMYNNNPTLCKYEQNIHWTPLDCFYNEDAGICRDCPTECNNQIYNYYEEECDHAYTECGLNFRCYHTSSECTDCPSNCNDLLGVGYGTCENKGDACGLSCRWQNGACIYWPN